MFMFCDKIVEDLLWSNAYSKKQKHCSRGKAPYDLGFIHYLLHRCKSITLLEYKIHFLDTK